MNGRLIPDRKSRQNISDGGQRGNIKPLSLTQQFEFQFSESGFFNFEQKWKSVTPLILKNLP